MLNEVVILLSSKKERKVFQSTIVDVAEVHQLPCFEESGQWLDNVDETHLALASFAVLS